MNYYNRGSLMNASLLANEGRGFVKVFRDRDEKEGGRAWGTRTLVGLIERVAEKFSERFPGRERIQVADIAKKRGGKTSHGSHQNGLDADIVYIRKNKKEQLPYGGYGKNGFAEQFVVRTSPSRKAKAIYVPSANFDTEANFNLMKMFSSSGRVKRFFVDKVLIREFFRYSEEKKISSNPEVIEFLMKLQHVCSHADHFHMRLFCQESDTKCVSENAPSKTRLSRSQSKKAAPKT